MIHSVELYRDTYVDSVVQLAGTRALRAVSGVDWAAAAMATPGNVATLVDEGFEALAGAGVNDLFVAVRAESDDVAGAARAAGEAAMFATRGPGPAQAQLPRTLGAAMVAAPNTNVAVISVPGDYATLEAHKALSAGLDVLLFSDNVPVAAEVALKTRAARLGRLVMGPGAGTAMLGHTGLGFANVVRDGRVAVVAAAGTGAQEAAALLDRWGDGVSHVIGLGGRDLGAAVGGAMALTAIDGLLADDATEVILLVSKPPAPAVAAAVMAASAGKPLVAALIGLDVHGVEVPDGVTVARTLEAGVVAALAAAGLGRPPDPAVGLVARVQTQLAGLPAERTLVRGLFSGGTLCYESLVVLADVLGPVHSNTPIDAALGLPAPDHAHMCLDLGEEEYTAGRPHPMIDPAARIELLRATGADPAVAVIVLDVVLGHGSHPDPGAELAPVCAEITAAAGPRIVVYVLGTQGDPQGLDRQRRAFADAGCVVTETAARASLAAAAIALRRPELAATPL
jgi:FdrA protein